MGTTGSQYMSCVQQTSVVQNNHQHNGVTRYKADCGRTYCGARVVGGYARGAHRWCERSPYRDVCDCDGNCGTSGKGCQCQTCYDIDFKLPPPEGDSRLDVSRFSCRAALDLKSPSELDAEAQQARLVETRRSYCGLWSDAKRTLCIEEVVIEDGSTQLQINFVTSISFDPCAMKAEFVKLLPNGDLTMVVTVPHDCARWIIMPPAPTEVMLSQVPTSCGLDWDAESLAKTMYVSPDTPSLLGLATHADGRTVPELLHRVKAPAYEHNTLRQQREMSNLREEQRLQERRRRQECNQRHIHVMCDGCEVNPIIGNRYKCTDSDLPDYDLCEMCYAKVDLLCGPGHNFKLIKVPLSMP